MILGVFELKLDRGNKNTSNATRTLVYLRRNNDMPRLVITGVRFSYCNLTTPKVPLSGGEPKYSATVLLPKSNVAVKAAIDKCIFEAIEEGVKTKWAGVRPPQLALPLHDGDSARPSDGMPYGDECRGHWVFTVSTKDKPQIVDRSVMPILNPSDIYSGMYGNVSVSFYPYFNSGKKGIGVGLGNVMKTEEGEPLAGRASAASDFASFAAEGNFTEFVAPAPIPAPVQPQYAPAPIPAPVQPQYAPAPVQAPIQYDPITGNLLI
jgi:hypothetical protein